MRRIIRNRKRRRNRLRRLRLTVAAGLITVVGAAITITPIPLGGPLMAGGVAMMSAVNRSVRRSLMFVRSRSRTLNASMRGLSEMMPGQFRRTLRLTDPKTYRAPPRERR